MLTVIEWCRSRSRTAVAITGSPKTSADPTEMGVGLASGSTWSECDSVAERSEPAGVVAGEAVGAHPVEVVAPELVIRVAVAEHVIRDNEDAVGDGDDGLLVAAAFDQPAVLSGEVAVAFAHRGAGALDERRAERPVGLARAAAEALARTLVGARAEAGPRRCMARGREARHVAAQLGHDDLGGPPRDPRNRVEAGQRVGLRGGARHDLAVAGRDGVVEELDVAQQLGEQKAVMRGDAAGERLRERCALPPQAPLRELRHLVWGVYAGDERLEHGAC